MRSVGVMNASDPTFANHYRPVLNWWLQRGSFRGEELANSQTNPTGKAVSSQAVFLRKEGLYNACALMFSLTPLSKQNQAKRKIREPIRL
jgi:hypothetical protein